MSRKLDNTSWEEYINKFDSFKGKVTVKDFCVESKLLIINGVKNK